MKTIKYLFRLCILIVFFMPTLTAGANDYNSVPYIMKQWPYEGNTGASVRNATIRGIKLGIPLPEAVKILETVGFSQVTGQQYQQIHFDQNGERKIASRKDYYNIPGNQRGDIIRSVTIYLTTTVPSNEIQKELPAFPEANVEAKPDPRMERYRAQMANMDESSRAQLQSRLDRTNRGSNRPVKKEYVTGITFSQKSMSGMEQVDSEALIEAARKNYGEPSYLIAEKQSIAAAGAAFGKSGGLWYCDSALEPKETIEDLLSKSGDDDRSMVFKDFIHPGTTGNAYYIQAYESLEERVAALRVANAPYMHVGFNGAAFTVDLQWPFLKAERDYRELWEKEQVYKKKPEADVQF